MDDSRVLKPLAPVVIVLFLILLAGSVFFYKERMLFIDAPHILFRIINTGRLPIEQSRYGSFITQGFPWVGMQLHLPLKALVLLYSISFYVFFIAVLLLLIYRYKRYGMAVLFGLYLTLFVSSGYYWTNNEVHQGIAWLFLGFALCFELKKNNRNVVLQAVVFLILFALAIWTHPLVMFAAIYLWGFYLLTGKETTYKPPAAAALTFVLLTLAYLKYKQSTGGWYDSGRISAVTGFDFHRLRHIGSSPQFRFFVKICITNYWLLILVFVAGTGGMVRERKYLAAAFTILYAVGFYLIICIEFWDVNTNHFYIESEYMPLALVCAAPFVYYVLPRFSAKGMVGVVSVIFAVRLVYIFSAAAPFTARVRLLDSMDNKMAQKGLTKVILPDDNATATNALVMNWAVPVESMLLSAMKGESPQRTFIFISPGDIKYSPARDTLLGAFIKWGQGQLNPVYFKMDTSTGYKVMEYDDLMR